MGRGKIKRVSKQGIRPYSELRDIYKYHIDSYIALFQLKTENEEEINSIYEMIKTELIDSNKHLIRNIIRDILLIIPFNNRYAKSYLKLAKLIVDDYHVTEAKLDDHISNFLFNKEYGIVLNTTTNFRKFNIENTDILSKDTIYRAIMYDGKERFIYFTESEDFKVDQHLTSALFPEFYCTRHLSLLELCCYYGAVDCFKLLRTKFNAEITHTCVEFSFLGGNAEIMSECIKYRKPDYRCMEYAIISHNIDFVTFLLNEYNIPIDLTYSVMYNNLDAFLVYCDQTNDFEKCFFYSTMYDIPSLCEYFLSLGVKINAKFENDNERNALHYAASRNCKETIKFLISRGINVNEKDCNGETALHSAAHCKCKDAAELLILHGVNLNEQNRFEETALHIVARTNSKETAYQLISHGANINVKDNCGRTPLHFAAEYNSKETAELLISHGANVNETTNCGYTPLQFAAIKNNKEMVELLSSHDPNVIECSIS